MQRCRHLFFCFTVRSFSSYRLYLRYHNENALILKVFDTFQTQLLITLCRDFLFQHSNIDDILIPYFTCKTKRRGKKTQYRMRTYIAESMAGETEKKPALAMVKNDNIP